MTRLGMTIAVVVIVAASAKPALASGGTVTVCVEGVDPIGDLNVAQVLANRLFATAGVVINWGQAPCPKGAVRMIVRAITPRSFMPGALAYATRYDRTRIEVFSDRIAAIERTPRANVLGYVMAHEITHVLQGFSRHSETGIMKARWNSYDYSDMRMMKLTFTYDDVKLIQLGPAFRAH